MQCAAAARAAAPRPPRPPPTPPAPHDPRRAAVSRGGSHGGGEELVVGARLTAARPAPTAGHRHPFRRGRRRRRRREQPAAGLEPVEVVRRHRLAAYCDHWVSNVRSRVGFLETLEETLGFTPKVDFNAGVVAAGEAQIESTVTGNASPLQTTEPAEALRDRAQVFLPTNNALSPVGHVHWYLEELGQGIQHVASRVASLPEYVQRANDMRAITGEGFTFLNIPRTASSPPTSSTAASTVSRI